MHPIKMCLLHHLKPQNCCKPMHSGQLHFPNKVWEQNGQMDELLKEIKALQPPSAPFLNPKHDTAHFQLSLWMIDELIVFINSQPSRSEDPDLVLSPLMPGKMIIFPARTRDRWNDTDTTIKILMERLNVLLRRLLHFTANISVGYGETYLAMHVWPRAQTLESLSA